MFRSLLFVPGNNPSMIQNADVFVADAIIFDLEDSVDVTEKRKCKESSKKLFKRFKNISIFDCATCESY